MKKKDDKYLFFKKKILNRHDIIHVTRDLIFKFFKFSYIPNIVKIILTHNIITAQRTYILKSQINLFNA